MADKISHLTRLHDTVSSVDMASDICAEKDIIIDFTVSLDEMG